MTSIDPLMSIDDACTYLGGISRSHLYRLIDNKQVDRVKSGGRALITRVSCDAYVARLANYGTVSSHE